MKSTIERNKLWSDFIVKMLNKKEEQEQKNPQEFPHSFLIVVGDGHLIGKQNSFMFLLCKGLEIKKIERLKGEKNWILVEDGLLDSKESS